MTIPRLYIEKEISEYIELGEELRHYVYNVMRLGEASYVNVFNEQGEYRAQITQIKKKSLMLHIQTKIAEAKKLRNLKLCFAPIKKIRMDYLIQKAVELGCTEIQPVKTEYCQFDKINYKKIQVNIIEASEQSGRTSIAKINKIVDLAELIKNWNKKYQLIFCDEKAKDFNTLNKISELNNQSKNFAVLIGPEGGFSEKERNLLLAQDFVTIVSLGELILRADTAAVVALSIVNIISRQKVFL